MKSFTQLFGIEKDTDPLRVIITPFKITSPNMGIQGIVIVTFLAMLVQGFTLTMAVIPIIILFLISPSVTIFLANAGLAQVIFLIILAQSFILILLLGIMKSKILLEIDSQGLRVKKTYYWFISGEWYYPSENIMNMRVSKDGLWATVKENKGLKKVEMSPGLSIGDSQKILSAICERYSIYASKNIAPSEEGVRKISRIKAMGTMLFIICFIGGLGTLIAYDPNSKEATIFGLLLVWILSIAMGVAGYFDSRRKNWATTFIVSFGSGTLTLALAVHILLPFLSGWLWIILMTGVYLLVWVGPFPFPDLARKISDGLERPHAWTGQKLGNVYSYALIGAVILIYVFVHNEKLSRLTSLWMGILFAVSSIVSGLASSCRVWNQRMKETQESEASD
jgi:hypothetical protein